MAIKKDAGKPMKIAYFDCFSGAAGDMIVGACLDAGASEQRVRKELARLNLPEVDLKIEKVLKNGISATAFVPEVVRQDQPRHRHLPKIVEILAKAGLSPTVEKRAIEIFQRLAQAEAKVHGTTVEKIHFHEVGAADAIMDVVGAAVALEALGIERVFCSSPAVGAGTVKCEHGIMPVPAPATAELIKGIEIAPAPVEQELLTPTGAAILTTITRRFGSAPAMRITDIGYGAGQRTYPDLPNVLRLLVGEMAGDATDGLNSDQVVVLEANLDDTTGELIGHVTELLGKAGALDVTCTPITMKKNRPATMLSVLCKPKDEAGLERIFFTESTTLGIRKHTCQRSTLPRRHQTVETPYGRIRIKVGYLSGTPATTAVEFEDCRQAAEEHHVSVKLVMVAAMSAYQRDGLTKNE